MFQIDRTIDLTQHTHMHAHSRQGHTSGEWTLTHSELIVVMFSARVSLSTALSSAGCRVNRKEVDWIHLRLSVFIVSCFCFLGSCVCVRWPRGA